MDRLSLHLANLGSQLLPQSRAFTLRRLLYLLGGVNVAVSAKINGTARIHHANVRIGPQTWLGAGCHLISTTRSQISIGSRCDIGPGVMIVVGTHEVGDAFQRAGTAKSQPISIGSGTWIGARSTLIAGARIGNGCIIAAGTIVNEKFPDNVLIAGVPGRVMKHLD